NLKGLLWGPLWLSTPVETRTEYVLVHTLDANEGTFSASLNGASMGSVSGAGRLQRSQGDPSAIGSAMGTTRFSDLGGAQVFARMKGYVAELRQWNVALTDTERGAVESELLAHYGIAGASAATSGDLAVLASQASSEAQPLVFGLDAPYPNPTSGAATVRYGLPSAGEVRISVYDALGRTVAVLVDGTREAGWHEVALDGTALASGVYLVRAEYGSEVVVQRLTRVR
ncbi:MAG: T9SS type A sorting domain-containing protein, partial [Bacteroidota bacterium]